MELVKLSLCNFQSFSEKPVTIDLEKLTFLLGPNGSGKTAVLLALVRLFGFERSLRSIRRTDFHTKEASLGKATAQKKRLWVEAHFEFPELKEPTGNTPLSPPTLLICSCIRPTGCLACEYGSPRRWIQKET
jgi:putative ATP-dependent endonuclease of the OLD family